MFATSLLPLPPPSTSLLPPLSSTPAEIPQQQLPHHLQSRRKQAYRLNNPLTLLANDERLIASRKVAIAMYGYSWLKPAGCTKTMLGRREEELEREEVERQLREVELQERMAMEQEEQERRAELQRQAEGGEVVGVDELDLDDEVPEAEEGDGSEEEGGGDGETEGEDMEGDLDDEVPDADADEQESSWVYDTRREADTESEEDGSSDSNGQVDNHAHLREPQGSRSKRPAQRQYTGQDDPAATEALVNAMLDEDELGEYEHDLDDDVPDMDGDLDDDMNMDMDMDANLSDAVPSAASSQGGWEHTDSELEESEMDISLLPPHPNSSSRNPGTTHEEMRRVSGNRMLPPPIIPSGQSRGQQHLPEPSRGLQTRTGPRNIRALAHTPATADDISALISTDGPSTASTAQGEGSIESRSPNRRSWLNPAAARRNLFSGLRGSSQVQAQTQAQTQSQGSVQAQSQAQGQPRTAATLARSLVSGVSSSGLFTPSPRHTQTPGQDSDSDDDAEEDEVPRSRTRSGRLLGLGRRARRDG